MLGFRKSPWIVHYAASSCNGCDIEVLASLTPMYDVERFGVINTGNPRHADILLITGSVNEQTIEVVRNIYHQLTEPKVVAAVGICATSGGIFRDCYNVQGGIDRVVPVDVYVPGCPVRPEALIDAVVAAVGILEEKRGAIAATAASIDKIIVERAVPGDAEEILALQKSAYASEAEIYNDRSLPALNQTLAELRADFASKVLLKGVVNGKIVASVRGYAAEGTGYISRVIVHPYFQKRGMGSRLISEMERHLAGVKRFEVFTGHRSERNLYLYGKLGYKPFRREPFSKTVEWVYMEKKAS
jgi:ech hydrogenase subunit C